MGGVNMRMRSSASRNSVPTSVAAVRFCRSLWAADRLSSLLFISALTVCSSSLIDCSSSFEVSSSSAVERYSSLMDCSSSLAARRSWIDASCLPAGDQRLLRGLELGVQPPRPRRAGSSSAARPPVRHRAAVEEQHQRLGAQAPSRCSGSTCMAMRRRSPVEGHLDLVGQRRHALLDGAGQREVEVEPSSGRTTAGSALETGPPECRMKRPALATGAGCCARRRRGRSAARPAPAPPRAGRPAAGSARGAAARPPRGPCRGPLGRCELRQHRQRGAGLRPRR